MTKAVEQFWRTESAARTIATRCIYVDLTGDLATGVLLSQIVYWFRPNADGSTKLRILLDSKYWIAKRRTDWWLECRLTPKQVRRSINVLRDLKLIETRVRKFHGTPMLFVHLRISELAQRAVTLVGPKGRDEWAERAATYSTKINYQGIPAMYTHGGKKEKASGQVLEKFKKKSEADASLPPGKVMTHALLIKLWRTMVPAHFKIGVMKPLTNAETALFKRIVRTAGKESGRITAWAILNWSKFLTRVREQTGTTVTAAYPSVFILAKHVDVAYRAMTEQPGESEVSEPVQLIAPPESPTEKKDVASLEQVEKDIKAILGK